jgi:GNAT superfamily N-acetyltransferase
VSAYALRAADAGDAAAVVAVTMEGFEGYRAFAPAGWEPPDADQERARLQELLGREDVWYLVATHEGDVVGHVGFLPAASLAWAPVDDPGLAHFRQLFVQEAHWGTGLATTLHAAAIEEARARGFTAMRLFTPARQERARRFYEREGWARARPPEFEERIGLEIAEYRRTLSTRAARGASPRRRPRRGR